MPYTPSAAVSPNITCTPRTTPTIPASSTITPRASITVTPRRIPSTRLPRITQSARLSRSSSSQSSARTSFSRTLTQVQELLSNSDDLDGETSSEEDDL